MSAKAVDGAKDYLQMNRLHWNALADKWWKERAGLLHQVKNGSAYIEQMEPKMAPYLRDIQGKKVIVLQFGDGLVMFACAKKGAVVIGVDLSGEQVRRAREAAKECSVDVKLVEADCQNLPESIRSSYFDLAVAECGIFIWIENLDAWMKNAYRVLKKGGKLIASDFHPLSICTQWKEGETMTFTRSYFDQQPRVKQEEGLPPSIEFIWKLSDVINAAISAGFTIDRVEEFYVEQKCNRRVPFVPTDFLLVATKK